MEIKCLRSHMDNSADSNKSSEEVVVEQKVSKKNEQVVQFLLHAITMNKPDIANFLFDKCGDSLEEIFASDDKRIEKALVGASASGYEEIVKLILERGEGKISQDTVEAAIEAAGSHKGTRHVILEKVTLDTKAFERLMFSSIESGDLDSVKKLFDKKK